MMRKHQLLIAASLLSMSTLGHAVCNGSIGSTASSSRFVDHNNGTVTDLQTGLMWSRCMRGQTYNTGSRTCTGNATQFTWGNALNHVNGLSSSGVHGYADWRMPNVKELISLVDESCTNPALNDTAFPGTALGRRNAWSSSPDAGNVLASWVISFSDGATVKVSKPFTASVFIVRDAPRLYRLLASLSSNDLCLDMPGVDTLADSNVSSFRCDTGSGSRDQYWWYDPIRKRFHNQVDDSRCLNATGSGASNVTLASCADSNNQRWDWVGNTIRSRVSGRNQALHVTGTSISSNIDQVAANPSDTQQQWEWGPDYRMVRARSNGLCWDVNQQANGVPDPGDPVIMFACNNTDNQRWAYNDRTNQFILEKRNGTTLFCLDQGSGAGGNLNIQVCNSSSNNQKFFWTANIIRLFHDRNFALRSSGGSGAALTESAASQNTDRQFSWFQP